MGCKQLFRTRLTLVGDNVDSHGLAVAHVSGSVCTFCQLHEVFVPCVYQYIFS